MSPDSSADKPVKDGPWVMRTYAGHSSAAESNKLYRTQPRQGSDRAVGGVRPAHADRLRPGLAPQPRGGRQGRCSGPAPGRDAPALRGHPADRDEHLDDDQRHCDVAAGALPGRCRGTGARLPRGATSTPRRCTPSSPGTTQNDIIKEYLSRGTYVFPPEHSHAPDRGHDRLHGQQHPEVEPHQHLQLPPAGGRRDADAGARLRAVHRDRRPRRGQGLRPGRARGLRQGRRPDLVLRQRRRPVRRGDVQDARVRRALGRDHPRALRRAGREDAPLPVRRPGELPRSDRGAAREQRPADRARDARRDALQERPGPRRPAACVERGPRPAAALGPAVVAAAAAGARLRVRPAGVRRHLRGLEGHRGQGRQDGRRARVPRSTGSRRWAARSRPSSRAT